MRLKPLIVCFCAVGLVSHAALARLGETEAQIEARYGKPIQAGEDDGVFKSRAYHSSGLLIAVEFEGGISQMETFGKVDRAEFSGAEIDLLLEVNRGGYNWLGYPKNEKPGQRAWCSTDQRSRVAYYIEGSRMLIVTSLPFLEGAGRLKNKKSLDRLKGF